MSTEVKETFRLKNNLNKRWSKPDDVVLLERMAKLININGFKVGEASELVSKELKRSKKAIAQRYNKIFKGQRAKVTRVDRLTYMENQKQNIDTIKKTKPIKITKYKHIDKVSIKTTETLQIMYELLTLQQKDELLKRLLNI